MDMPRIVCTDVLCVSAPEQHRWRIVYMTLHATQWCIAVHSLTKIDAVLFENRVQDGPDGCQMIAYGRARVAILARLELALFITRLELRFRPGVPVR